MSENCYLLLELEFDPPAIDQASIDQRIEEKAKFWSINSNDFKKGAEYKMYLEMLPEIKRIMSDPVKRKREADSACSIVYDSIDQDIKILGATGEIAEDVIENYANEKKIPVNVVKKRVSALGIKISANFQITYDKYYKNKPKNAEAFDGMNTYLKPFNKDDFYAFLNPGTLQNMDKLPCDKLKLLAQEKKRKDFYKNDTYSSAGKKVCEACELAFKDESSKAIYDDYLAWCKRKSILGHAKEISKITDKKMSDEQGDIYIGKLTELLKDRILAENIFISFCKIEKIEYNPDLYNPGKKEDKARQEAARQEAARQEAARQEAARQEAARKEAARQEAARQEATRQEAARKEAARQEAARQEITRQEAARQEAARQEAARQEAARQEAEKAKRNRQKKLVIGIVLCLLIFGGVALINATGLKDSQSTPSGVSQAPTDPIAIDEKDKNSTGIITVSDEPVRPLADFYADRTSGEAPLKVQFYDESTGSPTSWNWNFGDKVSSTKQSPTHTYTTAGVYTVTEIVTNELGKDTEVKTNYIIATSPTETPIETTIVETPTETPVETTIVETPTVTIPDADFSASQTTGEAPLTVTFADKSTGSPTEWKWDFGDGSPIIDGTTSAYKNPRHTYEKAGVYEVKETAINSAGRNTETKVGYIIVTAPESTNTISNNAKAGPDSGTASDNPGTSPGSGAQIASLPTKSEVLTFVNEYRGVSDFIETVSGNSKSYHPEWKWDMWQDQSGNKVISFYYQNNSKGYGSTYFDSEGNIISTKDLKLTLSYSYPEA